MALGAAAIIIPPIATIAVTIFFGGLFLLSGIVGLITTFWMRGVPGFWWSLISAILAIIVGVMLMGWPVRGAFSLTFLLIVFFIIEGVVSVMFALDHRRELAGAWGWMLASGIVDLVLATIILAGLPGTAAWVVTHLGIRPLSEANGHPADILGPSHRLTITLQGEGARYFNPAADIALPTTQGISAVACPPTAAATQPSDNAV